MTQKYEGFVPGSHEIDSFGAGGFRFADMSHRGSILVLPTGIRAWDATMPKEITRESLQAVFDEPAGSIELLLIGTGEFLLPLRPDVRAALKEAGIGTDPMATAHAIATYNILVAEKRLVAAALLAVS
jgi:uncharacterized protein